MRPLPTSRPWGKGFALIADDPDAPAGTWAHWVLSGVARGADDWGLRGVYTKGGKTCDIPLPSVVMKFLQAYVDRVLTPEVGEVTGDTPLFWSRWPGRHGVRRVMPIQGKSIWRLCKTHGRLIGVPELKPHDLRHGVAMEVLEQHHDLEQVRAPLGHTRVDTTQIYATIRPAQLKRAAFYEDKAARMLSG